MRWTPKLESFYFAFGDVDAYVTVDLPDNEAATACALAVNGAGGASVKIIQLLTPEEVDAAAKQSAGYRPPGSCYRLTPYPRSGMTEWG